MNDWNPSSLRENPSERLLAAVVLLADGEAERVVVGIRIADRDWRDLLVAADLAGADWERELGRRLCR